MSLSLELPALLIVMHLWSSAYDCALARPTETAVPLVLIACAQIDDIGCTYSNMPSLLWGIENPGLDIAVYAEWAVGGAAYSHAVMLHVRSC